MLGLLAALVFGIAANGESTCNLSYEHIPHELFSTAKVYLSGPPEEHIELTETKDVYELVSFLKRASPFDKSAPKDNSLIIGFFRFAGGDYITITETSLVAGRCSKSLSQTEHDELMSLLRGENIEN